MNQKEKKALKEVFEKVLQKEVDKILRELDKGAK